jgi:hypothetical protein
MLLPIALSFVKLCDPYENSFHAFMIRIHVHTTIYPDENIPTNDTSSTSTSSLPQQDTSHIPLAGPITRARACQLNNQVNSLLSSCTPCLDCGDTCIVGLLMNHGEEQLGKGFVSAGFGLQHNTNF